MYRVVVCGLWWLGGRGVGKDSDLAGTLACPQPNLNPKPTTHYVLQVIDQFLSTQESRERGYEEGELVLYKAHILEQVGPYIYKWVD